MRDIANLILGCLFGMAAAVTAWRYMKGELYVQPGSSLIVLVGGFTLIVLVNVLLK